MVFSLTATFSWFLHKLWPRHLMWVSHITSCLIHVRHVTCVLPFIILLCIMLTYAMETCQMAVCLSEDSSLHLSWLVSMWWCAFPLYVSLTHGSAWRCPRLGCRLRTTFHPLTSYTLTCMVIRHWQPWKLDRTQAHRYQDKVQWTDLLPHVTVIT
jgi:hypothetical protein